MDWQTEDALLQEGYKLIAGIDEAGRGPLAGPVVAGACILPRDFAIEGLNDSKKLSASKREFFAVKIKEGALAWGLGQATAAEIDSLNILRATKLAMSRALQNAALMAVPDFVLIDGRDLLAITYKQRAVIGGDHICVSIAAASILAKVERDGYMAKLHLSYPDYGFDKHKGYGTVAHMAALSEYGPCPEHRRSYAPVREAEHEHAK
jgi:ribonuclease HII